MFKIKTTRSTERLLYHKNEILSIYQNFSDITKFLSKLKPSTVFQVVVACNILLVSFFVFQEAHP